MDSFGLAFFSLGRTLVDVVFLIQPLERFGFVSELLGFQLYFSCTTVNLLQRNISTNTNIF